MAQHTPGPWTFEYDNSDSGPHAWYDISSENGHILKWNYNNKDSDVYEANARLIVAAPEMLEALHNAAQVIPALSSYIDGYNPREKDADDATEIIRAAIAKATGQQS